MVDMYANVDDRIVFYKTLNCHKVRMRITVFVCGVARHALQQPCVRRQQKPEDCFYRDVRLPCRPALMQSAAQWICMMGPWVRQA